MIQWWQPFLNTYAFVGAATGLAARYLVSDVVDDLESPTETYLFCIFVGLCWPVFLLWFVFTWDDDA